ncbi:MAG: tyrosine-type recombinase/integrase [Acidobacteria bacterium]|nr:tyrosine-type recombinase/integrase [Acidobacteriota bacterium]
MVDTSKRGRPKTLSAAFVRSVAQPGRYGDGRGGYGLSLLVKPMASTGRLSKTWAVRTRIAGRPANVGAGRYPVVSLSEARAKALEVARATAQGLDPRGARVPTFEEAVERVIELHEPTWKHGARSAGIWRSSLGTYAMPLLGRLSVADVTTAHVLSVLTPIWTAKPVTARRVRQRIGAVMKWGVAKRYRGDNPAGDAIAEALPKTNGAKAHMRALPHAEVGAALHRIRESGAWPSTKLAIEFLTLTAARSGEVRLATWAEVDRDRALWRIPAERTKTGRLHRVPLSGRAVDVLREAARLADGSELVFPSASGRALSDNTLSKLLRELGLDGTPHGMRSAFRSWCAETNQPRELAEAALAHVVRGVEGAYQRSDVLAARRSLMQDWAGYLSRRS